MFVVHDSASVLSHYFAPQRFTSWRFAQKYSERLQSGNTVPFFSRPRTRGKVSYSQRESHVPRSMTEDAVTVEHPKFIFHLDARGKPVIQHNDALADRRWSPMLCTQVFNDRDWHSVAAFFAQLPPLSSLTPEVVTQSETDNATRPADTTTPIESATSRPLTNESEESIHANNASCSGPASHNKANGGKWDRVTWQIEVAYNGAAFAGWQRLKENGLPTVQGVLESALLSFGASKSSSPCPAQLTVAGRTDKGVHAARQVCAFHTWKRGVDPASIVAAVNSASPGNIKALSAREVPRSFHPVFSACWRRYLYLLPLNEFEGGEDGVWGRDVSTNCHQETLADPPIDLQPDFSTQSGHQDSHASQAQEGGKYEEEGKETKGVDPALPPNVSSHAREAVGGGEEGGGASKRCSIHVSTVDSLLRSLENEVLCFTAMARDTKAGRSSGAATVCHVYRARAHIALLPLDTMVRVLVATAIREAGADGRAGALERLLASGERRATAPPMPPQGLCLVEVGYSIELPPPIGGN